MSKKLAHFYSESKLIRHSGQLHIVYGENGTLFSGGIYLTKIMPEDLPEWYIRGRYYRHWGYLCAKGIKYLVYDANKQFNHMFKDDYLYISYDKPIVSEGMKQNYLHKFSGFSQFICGSSMVQFLRAAEMYSGYDISKIKEQIEDKRLWFKETYPEFYAVEVSQDKPFF